MLEKIKLKTISTRFLLFFFLTTFNCKPNFLDLNFNNNFNETKNNNFNVSEYDNFNDEEYDEFDNIYIDDDDVNLYTTNEPLRMDNFLPTLKAVLKQIKQPIWKHTKPPKGRDILYLIPHKFTAIKYGRIDLNLLYNQTPKMNVTARDLVDLDSNVVEVIKVLLKDNKLTSEQLSQLVPLFTKAIIQERRLAGLLQTGFTYKYFNVQLHTSLQAAERNFWISKKDQKTIEEMFEGEDKTFDKKELYKIRYGPGDTRIKLGLNTLNTGSVQFDVGFEGIIPTAKKQKLPKIDNSYLPATEDALKTWMLENLKAIRDNLINPQLGNNGHFGLGFFMESKYNLFHESLNLWARFSIDNLFEANEDRLILFKKTIDADKLTPFPKPLSRFIRENVFPPAFTTRIKPGDIISLILNFSFNINKKWQWGVGYDLYIQDKEEILKVLDDEVSAQELRIEDAQSPRATQHKIFSETNFTFKKDGWDFIFGVGADTTFRSENIGKDWTVYLRFGAAF